MSDMLERSERPTLFLDEDGDLCRSGGGDNLIACVAFNEEYTATLNGDLLAEIVAYWNRRADASDPAVAALVDALEQIVREYGTQYAFRAGERARAALAAYRQKEPR